MLIFVFFFFMFSFLLVFDLFFEQHPGIGFCAKNTAVIITMSDILQLQDGHRIQFYKSPKVKICAKTQKTKKPGRKFTKCKCAAPFEKRCII